MNNPWFVWGVRVVLAGTFLAAGIPKILAPHDFALVVYHYQMLPDAAINPLAVYLPWLEVLAGVLLLIRPRLVFPAALILLGLLLVFTGAQLINVWRGINVACGCFSVSTDASRIGWLGIGRNLVLLGLAGYVLGTCRRDPLAKPAG